MKMTEAATVGEAQHRSAPWRLLAAASLLLVGGVWIGLSVWAAGRAGSVIARTGTDLGAAHAIALGAALLAALAGHTVFFWRVKGRPALMAPLIAAAAWAGLAAEGHVIPTDAAALVIIVGAWLAGSRKLPAAAPVGAATGLAVALSPLLVGSVLGLFVALRGGGRARTWWSSLTGWTVAALIIGLAVEAVVGSPVWASPAELGVVYKLGPAAVWRHLAWLMDLAAPVLVVGALGAVAATAPCDPSGAGHRRARGAQVYRGLGIWLVFNAVLACFIPRLCAEHLLVMIAPAALLVAPGWWALRRMVSTSAPMTTALPGAVCLFLLGMLSWTPAREAGRVVLIALLPP